jgi:HTH-type transcriptional regulator / antitoxin HigA
MPIIQKIVGKCGTEMASNTKKKSTKDSYLDCVIRFPLKAIKTERQHDEAVAVIGQLSIRGQLDAGELEYLEALSRLIGDYEEHAAERVKLSTRDPIDVLKFLMKEGQLSISSLGRIIGSQGVASEILSGKRELSKGHIHKLAHHFHVEPGLFI